MKLWKFWKKSSEKKNKQETKKSAKKAAKAAKSQAKKEAKEAAKKAAKAAPKCHADADPLECECEYCKELRLIGSDLERQIDRFEKRRDDTRNKNRRLQENLLSYTMDTRSLINSYNEDQKLQNSRFSELVQQFEQWVQQVDSKARQFPEPESSTTAGNNPEQKEPHAPEVVPQAGCSQNQPPLQQIVQPGSVEPQPAQVPPAVAPTAPVSTQAPPVPTGHYNEYNDPSYMHYFNRYYQYSGTDPDTHTHPRFHDENTTGQQYLYVPQDGVMNTVPQYNMYTSQASQQVGSVYTAQHTYMSQPENMYAASTHEYIDQEQYRMECDIVNNSLLSQWTAYTPHESVGQVEIDTAAYQQEMAIVYGRTLINTSQDNSGTGQQVETTSGGYHGQQDNNMLLGCGSFMNSSREKFHQQVETYQQEMMQHIYGRSLVNTSKSQANSGQQVETNPDGAYQHKIVFADNVVNLPKRESGITATDYEAPVATTQPIADDEELKRLTKEFYETCMNAHLEAMREEAENICSGAHYVDDSEQLPTILNNTQVVAPESYEGCQNLEFMNSWGYAGGSSCIVQNVTGCVGN